MELELAEKRRNMKEIQIPYRWVVGCALGYLVLPISIFFLTWVRWYIGIPATALLIAGLFFLMKNSYSQNKEVISIGWLHACGLFLFLLIWVWTCGIGNFFIGAYDHPWRTAIFRDMIDFSWPIVYPETGNAFVYYLFYWFVPALVGKAFGWTAGNVALVLWTHVGLILTFLLLVHVTKAVKVSHLWIVAILFFGWSGLNTVGCAIMQVLNLNAYPYGLNSSMGWLDAMYNGYSFNFFYRSNQETLMQIFNQAAPLWIATLLTLDGYGRVENFAYIGLCLLPFAPLPFLGLVIIMLAIFVKQLSCAVKRREIVPLLKKVFSIPNLTAAFSVFPIVALFFMCNSTTAQGAGGGFMLLPLELFDKRRLFSLVLFWVLEFGLISVLIFSKYKKNYLFYVVVGTLIISPLIEYGKHGGRDFCMNATLPALFVLLVFTIRYIFDYVVGKPLHLKNFLVVLVLIFSLLSPVKGFVGRIDTILDLKVFPVVDDSFYSFRDKAAEDNVNFLVENPQNTFFFKYIAK